MYTWKFSFLLGVQAAACGYANVFNVETANVGDGITFLRQVVCPARHDHARKGCSAEPTELYAGLAEKFDDACVTRKYVCIEGYL